jgi:CubicO group peptidase (beta-lactamase class C family)
VGQPGDHIVRYSDLGLMLLGEATSRLHGRPLDETLRARVFVPLHLPSLTFNPLASGRDRNTIAATEDDPGWRGRRCWGEVP